MSALVGRERDLAELAATLADPRRQGIVVTGPAGVGKSRLAEEGLRRAAAAGMSTARATVDALPAAGSVQLVLIDDLHLFDAATARTLRAALAPDGFRLLATARTGGRLPAELAALPSLRRLELSELDRSETERLLHALLDGPVSRPTLTRLYRVTLGNPLFLRELVAGCRRSGALRWVGEVWHLAEGELPVTERLAELVCSLLAAFGDAGTDLLDLLALCGPLPEADAARIAGPAALEAMAAAGLVHLVVAGRRFAVTMSHPLYGEVLRTRIGPLRRRMLLLGQIQRTQAHGLRRRDDPPRIAAWQVAAAGTAEPAPLIEAASRAHQAGDHRLVLTLLRAVPAAAHTATTRGMLGLALADVGEWEETDALLAGMLAETRDEPAALLLTVGRVASLLWAAGRPDLALAANDEGRARIATPALVRVLRVNEGGVRAVSGDPAGGVRGLTEDLPWDHERLADANAWLYGGIALGMGLAVAGDGQQGIHWAEHAYETHCRLHRTVLLSNPAATRLSLVFALAECGRLAAARAAGEACVEDLVASGTTAPRAWAAFYLGRVEWLAGHLRDARRWYAESVAVARSQRHVLVERLALVGLAAAASALGETAGAAEARDHAAARPVSGVLAGEDRLMSGFLAGEERLGEAWSHAARGHIGPARAVLREAAARARDTGHHTSEGLLLTDVVRLGGGRREDADRLAELAAGGGNELATARAGLAAALLTRDAERLMAVADAFEATGADLLAAESAAVAAAVHDRAGRRSRASAARFRAAAPASRCPGARTPLLALAGGTARLTPREWEIAVLASTGRASKDIAAALGLSARTVDNSLRNTFAKLGVSTRRDLREALGP
ncbi:LuxR C-terminal-related transcriptional regulator [Dactylosporangium sp. NPDC049525]|uniref:helix-turn-helix transcriptional regulator n=1 Tax=Dactylosporangium sp. NPDC049525 TaxID=3154730 RepID=UPI00343C312D